MQINSYLNFNGQCEAAFKFYEKGLGGKIEMMMPFAGTPMEKDIPAGGGGKIVHARMTVGNNVLMVSDGASNNYSKPGGFAVNINVDDPAEAERIYNALSEKATVHMPLGQTFWAKRFAMFTDQFGTPWMINCE